MADLKIRLNDIVSSKEVHAKQRGQMHFVHNSFKRNTILGSDVFKYGSLPCRTSIISRLVQITRFPIQSKGYLTHAAVYSQKTTHGSTRSQPHPTHFSCHLRRRTHTLRLKRLHQSHRVPTN